MATKIQLRRGNASAWTSTNPVLSSGEFGVESDTVRFKIGDGSNTWSNLAYFYSGAATTTTVSEGANLYFTNTRAVSALTPGTGINIGANGLITSTALGGVTSVNGANGNVQLFYSNNTFPNVNTPGTIWYKPDDGNIFILVNDGTANVWLEIDTPFFDYNSNTTDIPEGANLYFTNTRAISALTPGFGISIGSNGLVTAVLSGAGSGNITEVAGVTSGTVSNIQLGAAVYGTGVFTTANVIESGNLYFTNNRAISSLTPGYGIEIAANGRVTALLSAGVAGVTTGNVSNAQLGLAVIDSGALNTSNVIEGSNLYFTNTRAVSALTPGFGINIEANGMVVALLSGAGAGNITEVAGVTSGAVSNNQLGAAVYGTGVFTTSNVIEGANLYFTNTRAISSLTAGSGLSIAANGLITSSGAVTSVAGQIGAISNAQLASALTNSALGINSLTANTITSNTWSGIYTANVIETTDNLYFTNTRAIGALTAGRGIEVAANGQITSLYNIESIAGIANGSVSNVQLAFAIQNTTLLNTANIIEGGNLYFTNARVYANVIDIGFTTNTYVNDQLNNKANTVDLNVFATNNHVTAVVNLLQTTKANNEDVTNLTTGNIPENGNLYFTNTRAISALYTDSSLVLEPNGRIIANVSAIGGGTITSVGGINSGSVSNAQLASALNASTITPDNVTVTGTATIQSLRVNGDMTVDGTATFITSTTVAIDDKNIVLANGAADAGVADGAGISISGAYANLTYYVTPDRFNFNKNVDILGNTVLTNAITTTNLTEGANLYFTNTRARNAFTAGGGVILDANGMVSISSGNVGSIASFAYTPAVTNIDVGFFLGNYLMTPYSGLNPEITVMAGTSLAFDLGRIVSITNHPFTIKNVINGVNVESGISLVTSDGSTLSGAAAQGKTSGRMFWRVPRNLAGNVYVYQSTANSSVSGNIRILLGDYIGGSGIEVNANGMILNTEQYANSKVKSYLGNVDGDIVPAGNEIYNIGSPTRRWANLYLAGNTIILGDTKIQSSNDGSLVIRSTNTAVTSAISFSSNGYIASEAGSITTSNVAEGANLYFTNTRVVSALTAGANISIAANGMVTALTQGGGGGGGGSVYDTNTTSTGYLALSAGTTAQRPVSPSNGAIRFNTSNNWLEYYYDNAWYSINSTNLSLYTIDYFVVAGGGAGGNQGGGGAGGYLAGNTNVTAGVSYTVTIGAGGTYPGAQSGYGYSGSNSTFVVTATGGGGGAAYGFNPPKDGLSGGSGGGGGSQSGQNGAGGLGTPGQGFNGGAGNSNGATFDTGGGGGGASQAGAGGAGSTGGNGGNGIANPFPGSTVGANVAGTFYVAGGGGGAGGGPAVPSGATSSGGNGGGGGGIRNGTATAGTINTGGGGGAGVQNGGASGGKGVVVIRYAGTQRGTGGNITTSGGYVFHTFNDTGTFIA